jgi:hypothetical protein
LILFPTYSSAFCFANPIYHNPKKLQLSTLKMAVTCRRCTTNEEFSIPFGEDIKWDSSKGRSRTIIYHLELAAQKSQFVDSSEISQSAEASRQQVQEDNQNEWDYNGEDKLNHSVFSWLHAIAEPDTLEMA